MVELIWRLISKAQYFIKYSLVGMVGVAINFTTLWLLTEQAHLWYMLSATIAIALAATNNFILNYLWTFKHRKHQIGNLSIGWLKFLVSIGTTELAYLGLIYLFTEKLGLFYMLSAFLSLSCTTIIRYSIATKWVWKRKNRSNVIA